MHLELIAFLAGLISSTAAIPQIVRMLRTKKTSGVSTPMFCMKNCSNSLWLIFGVMSGTYSIIFWNVISLTLCTTVVVMKYRILREKAKNKKINNNIIHLVVNNVIEEPIYVEPKKHALILAYSRPKPAELEITEMPEEQISAPVPQA